MTTSLHLPISAPSRQREERMPRTASRGIWHLHTWDESTAMPVSCQWTPQPRLFSRLTME